MHVVWKALTCLVREREKSSRKVDPLSIIALLTTTLHNVRMNQLTPSNLKMDNNGVQAVPQLQREVGGTIGHRPEPGQERDL